VAAAASAPVLAPAGDVEAPPRSAPAAEPARPLAPSVQRIVAENSLDPAAIAGSGKDGRITKGDALAALEARSSRAPPVAQAPSPAPVQAPAPPRPPQEREERVRMTRLRQTIARRLKEAQNNAAMLTTFNEVDMSAVMALRNPVQGRVREAPRREARLHELLREGLRRRAEGGADVNAEIDGTDLIYKNHYDIGVAVGTERGLVVPVVRDADALSLAGDREGHRRAGQARRATASWRSRTCRAAPSPSPTAGSTAR
jgi:2-oxoglutarate dehydrogenase E2 component (dihydrolipoamide succinyltransferase)